MKNLFRVLILMAIAIIGIGAAAACDIGSATDFDNTDLGNIVVDDGDIDSIAIEEDIADDVVIDEETNFEPDTIDSEGVVIEDNETPAIDVADETSDIDDEVVAEDEESVYSKIMRMYEDHDFTGLDEDEILELFRTENEIFELYGAGHTTDKIAPKYNMTADQIQNIANLCFPSIKEDPSCDAIYKLYGSHTLKEISEKTGLSEQNILLKINAMREGRFGKFFKKILLKRDLILMKEKHTELIIK